MAVVDKKKGSILILKQYQPNVPFVALNGGSSIIRKFKRIAGKKR
jgi:hypothetical protein